ncbi:hypothetical protein [Mycolicibacterium fortuitum]|uniref:hypothetical protein n=1 Tax=Mycolicibacterium fortuitum TaxID=1766 RepID=UPI001041DAAB|nr:hypothetical protein [Mycolicibacterium fortuitum]
MELCELGYLGEQGLNVVAKLMGQELRRFPSLSSHELDDMTQDFLVDRIKPLTASLLAQATNDTSMGKLLRRSIKNWLIDRARATGTGPLRRTIEKMLDTTAMFERVDAGEIGAGRWRLAGSAAQPWGGNVRDLIVAAWSVPGVGVPKWSSDTRRAPIADRASLVGILRAVFERAEGSLEIAELVYVFANRFAAALDPSVSSIDDEQHPVSVPARVAGPEDNLIAEEVALDIATAAAEIAGHLTATEREVLPLIGDSSAVRLKLGKGRSQSAAFGTALKRKIRELAGTGEDAEEIAREVIALCGGVPLESGQHEG